MTKSETLIVQAISSLGLSTLSNTKEQHEVLMEVFLLIIKNIPSNVPVGIIEDSFHVAINQLKS